MLEQISFQYTKLINNYLELSDVEKIEFVYLHTSTLNGEEQFKRFKDLFMVGAGSRTYMYSAATGDAQTYMKIMDYEKEIAKMYNVHVTTIERIQAGKIRHDENIDYPIRKYSKYEVIALAIIEDLKNTTLTHKEIGAKYGVGEDISCRINTGKRYNYLYNGDYPIRKK